MVEIIRWQPGMKISRPCIIRDMPISEYHDDCCDGPSVSSSGLRKLISESPADFWDSSYLNPEGERFEESKALLLGRAVHHLILGQAAFSAEFVIRPETYPAADGTQKPWSGNAKWCKDWKAGQEAAGKSVLTTEDAEIIKGMARSLAKDEMVRAGLLNGLVEHSLFWRDKATGIWLKCRPDTIPVLNSSGASADVTDLKTVGDVLYESCLKSYEDWAYYQQAALIRQGMKEVLNIETSTFTLMFVEKKRPFSTRPMLLKDADMDLGDNANRVALDVMQQCLKTKIWPGPGRGPGRDLIEYLSMSDRARERIENNVLRLKDTFELKG